MKRLLILLLLSTNLMACNDIHEEHMVKTYCPKKKKTTTTRRKKITKKNYFFESKTTEVSSK